MFETQDFREQLLASFLKEAGSYGIGRYEEGIIDYLQRLASNNERDLMEREFRKSAAERRGISHALRSVELLTREAAQYARSEGRDVIRLEDIQNAYKAKFCQFWPFCKS